MIRVCPFCEGSKTEPFENTRFHICNTCGLFINEVMSEEKVKDTNKNFLLSACHNPKNREGRLREADELQCTTLEKYIGVGRVYDIGSASGFFLKAAKDRGWEVYGNEISTKAIEWEKENYNIDLDYGFFEETDVADNHFDAVVLWNTLEHTHNPKTTLDKCNDVLREGGLIYIKVPNNHTAQELNKNYEPVHLFEFTDDCLMKHLEAAGFEEVEVEKRDVCPNYGVVAARYVYRKAAK